MKTITNNKTTLVTVGMSTYFSIVNFFHLEGNIGKYIYNTDNNTGNKTWKDKNGNVVAKRVVNMQEDDIYQVEENLLNQVLKAIK